MFADKRGGISPGSVAAGPLLTLSPDGRRLATDSEGSIRVFDLATGRPIAVMPSAEENSNWLAFSPDGKSLALGRSDGEIRIHDLDQAADR